MDTYAGHVVNSHAEPVERRTLTEDGETVESASFKVEIYMSLSEEEAVEYIESSESVANFEDQEELEVQAHEYIEEAVQTAFDEVENVNITVEAYADVEEVLPEDTTVKSVNITLTTTTPAPTEATPAPTTATQNTTTTTIAAQGSSSGKAMIAVFLALLALAQF